VTKPSRPEHLRSPLERRLICEAGVHRAAALFVVAPDHGCVAGQGERKPSVGGQTDANDPQPSPDERAISIGSAAQRALYARSKKRESVSDTTCLQNLCDNCARPALSKVRRHRNLEFANPFHDASVELFPFQWRLHCDVCMDNSEHISVIEVRCVH